MIIYFDESYDNAHQYLILAALFNPHQRFLHRKLSEVKGQEKFLNENGSLKEIKYADVDTGKKLRIAKKAVDIFFESTSWFRCIVITQKLVDLNRFGKPFELESIKRARMYKKFAELLIAHNTENVSNASLFVDGMTRCKGDEFIEVMKSEFCLPFGKHSPGSHLATLNDVREISSASEQYQVNQINDILAGCVLNNLVPTSQRKNELRNHLIGKLGQPDLLPNTWQKYGKKYVEKYFPKFNIWYWKPNN